MSFAISANRLTDGAVIFLARDKWAEGILEAEVFSDRASAEAALTQRGLPAAAANLLVEPTIIDVRGAPGAIEAAHIREAIRARGPSVRPDLGKQARQPA
jgi:sulfite reductase (NADPH) hemoprotein beta-component